MMNKLIGLSILGLTILTSCSYNRSPDSGNYDPNDPGFEFAPDMYHAVPYEPLKQVAETGMNPYNEHGMSMRKPPEGTVARGKLDYAYPFPNTPEGYEMAGQKLTNPYKANDSTLIEGKRLYLTFCDHCHGASGNSEGPIMESGKFPKPHFGSFNSEYIKGLPDGKIFHTITFGKNLMGAHGSQIDPKERWLITLYIRELSKGNN